MPRATDSEIEAAARILREGGLVVFPTETVYGLGANAFDDAAVARIYAVKGRPADSPLIIHAASVEMAKSVTAEWPPAAGTLARAFWPGPLTLVLPKALQVPDRVTAGLGTVGVRVPRHPVALRLIELAGTPIAAPSANPFTRLSPTTAEHAREALGNQVDAILDGGPTEVGIESTVLSLAGELPALLRPGMIAREQIEALIGPIGREEAPQAGEGAHAAPGMHERHYRPRTPLILLGRQQSPAEGRGVYLYWTGPRTDIVSIALPADAAEYAARLYALLHQLDREGWDFIAVEPVLDTPEWAGIRDRLGRAAHR